MFTMDDAMYWKELWKVGIDFMNSVNASRLPTIGGAPSAATLTSLLRGT